MLGISFSEEYYNQFLKKGWSAPINGFTRYFCPPLFRKLRDKTEEIIGRYLDELKPQALISIIPFVNLPASEAARKRGIPFLLITTDNDLTNWVHELEHISHPRYEVTIGTDLPTTRTLLEEKGVPKSRIHTIGLPLRRDFLYQRDKTQLHQTFEVPPNKPILTIMMGGAGGRNAVEFTQRIAEMGYSAHLVVCTGKNERLGDRIRQIKAPPEVSIEAVGFTEDIADLIALSDLLITKPGPGTLNEAFALKVPLLLDNTQGLLHWERANVELARHYGVAMIADHASDLDTLVPLFLKRCSVRERLHEALQKVPSNEFHRQIGPLVEGLVPVHHASYAATI